MAGHLNRIILAFSVPTLLALVSLVWFRRRKKNGNSLLLTSIDESESELVKERKEIYLSSPESSSSVLSVVEETNEEVINRDMQLIECSQSSVCSEERVKSSDISTVSIVEKQSTVSDNENIVNIDDKKERNELTDELIFCNESDQLNNNFNGNANTVTAKCIDNESKTHLTKLTNSDQTDNVTNDEIEYECVDKISGKLFSDCFQTEKQKNGENLSSHENSVKRCRETSGSGFISGSSEVGSQNGNFSDIHSEGSCDSGKGGSDIQHGNVSPYSDAVIIYQFELPQQLCGLLIGKQGFYIRSIKEQSNVNVVVNRHPFLPFMKICTIEGCRYQIKYALQMIRKRFPLTQYPNVTLRQINVITPMSCPVPLSQSCQLVLPVGVTSDVILSCMVDAGHIFLQQPTHPTYPSLSRLDQCMTSAYNANETPTVPNPTAGIICAVKAKEGWFRAVVVHVYDNDECEVKFVDYGGYSKIPISELRQIRIDFMTLPFQTCECLLANVEPVDENGWNLDANTLFEDLAQGQILQASIVGYSETNVPYVHLYLIQGASTVFINRELVNRGVAKWIQNIS